MARIGATLGKTLDSVCSSLDAVNDGVDYMAAAMQQLRKEQTLRHKVDLLNYAADLAVESGKKHADRLSEISKIAGGDATYAANFEAGYTAALATLGIQQ
jgi:hypothetical protein